MKIWQNNLQNDKIAMIQTVAIEKNIDDKAVEKDWWVTVVLKALFRTSCSEYLSFKGGTSLGKAWNLIHRFSEDVDISISREFFLKVLNIKCAECKSNTQMHNLREISRDYIHHCLSQELDRELRRMGVENFSIENKLYEGTRLIAHDSDPTVINVKYKSIYKESESYVLPIVKVEISCLSMSEPVECKEITSLIYNKFPQEDDAACSMIKTVTPARTFLEKAFLLNEEFQRDKPRVMRMSRHLYDLERIMDTEYAMEALANMDLYRKIIVHRKKFYHIGYVDYEKNLPGRIAFCPTGELLESYRDEYDNNMRKTFIYGEALAFDELMARLKKLQERFRELGEMG